MSRFICHLSPTPTAIAMDPPPANSPMMHSRLVHQDRTRMPTNNTNWYKKKHFTKGFLNFAMLVIWSSTISLQLVWKCQSGSSKRVIPCEKSEKNTTFFSKFYFKSKKVLVFLVTKIIFWTFFFGNGDHF